MSFFKGLTKDDVDFDSTWNMLSTAFLEIHGKNASKLSFEELFRGAYKLVLKKKQDMLHDRVMQLERTWLRDNVRAKIVSLITPALTMGDLEQNNGGAQSNERRLAGERFIRALKDAFADHQLCMGMITDVLMYMVSVSFYASLLGTTLTVPGSGLQPGSGSPTNDLRECHGTLPDRGASNSHQP